MNCTFFGHKDCSLSIACVLEPTIENLIQNKNTTHFYIGNHGNFDQMALRSVINLKIKYHFITYEIVLAYCLKNENRGDFHTYFLI